MDLSSSSCYYQRLMNEVVSGLPQVYCYLDDLIIMSQSYDEHVQLLRQVFSRLCEHGLVVKESKCFFAVHSLIFGIPSFPRRFSAFSIQSFCHQKLPAFTHKTPAKSLFGNVSILRPLRQGLRRAVTTIARLCYTVPSSTPPFVERRISFMFPGK